MRRDGGGGDICTAAPALLRICPLLSPWPNSRLVKSPIGLAETSNLL